MQSDETTLHDLSAFSSPYSVPSTSHQTPLSQNDVQTPSSDLPTDPDSYYRSFVASSAQRRIQDGPDSASPTSRRLQQVPTRPTAADRLNAAKLQSSSAGTPTKKRGTSGIQEGLIGDRIKAFNQITSGASPRSAGLNGTRSSSATRRTGLSQTNSQSRRSRASPARSSRNSQIRSQSSPNTRSSPAQEAEKMQLLFGEILAGDDGLALGQGISDISQPHMTTRSQLSSIAERASGSTQNTPTLSISAPSDMDVFHNEELAYDQTSPTSPLATRSRSSPRTRRRSDASVGPGNSGGHSATAGADERTLLQYSRDGRSRRQPSPGFTLSSRRYSPKRVVQNPQTLTAVVHASPSKLSPTLKSSRPRQPVTTATTSASRARLAEKFKSTNEQGRNTDGRMKPHIPGDVDVAARRARLQDKLTHSNPTLSSDADRRSNRQALRKAKSRDQMEVAMEEEPPLPDLDLGLDFGGLRITTSEPVHNSSETLDDVSDLETPITNGSIKEALFRLEGPSNSGTDSQNEYEDAEDGSLHSSDLLQRVRQMRNSAMTDGGQTRALEDFLSDRDDAETVQMFLGKTPILPEWSEESPVPPLPSSHSFLESDSASPAEDNLDNRSIYPDDSISVAFGHQSRAVSRPPLPETRDHSQHTLDSAARSQINHVLDEYQETNVGRPAGRTVPSLPAILTPKRYASPVSPKRDDMHARSVSVDMAEGIWLSPSRRSPSRFDANAETPRASNSRVLNGDAADLGSPIRRRAINSQHRFHSHSASDVTVASDSTVRDLNFDLQSRAPAVPPKDPPVMFRDRTPQMNGLMPGHLSGGQYSLNGTSPVSHQDSTVFNMATEFKRNDSFAPGARSADSASTKSQASSISYDSSGHPSLRQTTSAIEREFGVPAVPLLNRDMSTPAVGSDKSASATPQSIRPSLQADRRPTSSSDKPRTLEKDLNERRNCIKELIDTEHSYSQDMTIMEDIYMGTATSVLGPDDVRILFGNLRAVRAFSVEFLDALRPAAAAVYTIPRENRWNFIKRGSFGTSSSAKTDTSGSTQSNLSEQERADADLQTTVGQVFLSHMSAIEKTYSDWIVKTNDAANAKLKELQQQPTTKYWLDECYAQAKDLTQAWSLDALLIKPAQRLMKYPLLLAALTKSTRPDHPDYQALKQASEDVILLTSRINDAKKRAELVDQAMNRKRKDSDAKGISVGKLLNRRTEKLKQHVGLSLVADDQAYEVVQQKFGGHYFQLQIVMRDVEKYLEDCQSSIGWLTMFVRSLVDYTQIDRQQKWPEFESNWLRVGQAVQEIQMIALQDHTEQVKTHVILPIAELWRLYAGPQKMMHKRKKRLMDHVRYKTAVQKGEKPDRKLQNEEDEFNAVNEVIKEELPKLYALTKKLIESCLMNFIDLQAKWQDTLRRKLSPFADEEAEAADLSTFIATLLSTSSQDLIEWEVRMKSYGICNGAALAEAQNFLSPQLSQTTTDEGRLTPGARRSTLSGGQRTVSSTSTLDHSLISTPYIPGQYSHQGQPLTSPSSGSFRMPDGTPYEPTSRMRAASTYSSRGAGTPRTMSGYLTPQTHLSTHGPPPQIPAGFAAESNNFFQGLWGNDLSAAQSQQHEAGSSSTQPLLPSNQSIRSHHSRQSQDRRTSQIFSSALPMSDTPPSPTPQGYDPEAKVLFLAASLFEFNIDGSRREGGFPYLRYVPGEIFDVIGQKGELWLARNQDDPAGLVGWIWEKHFAKLLPEED